MRLAKDIKHNDKILPGLENPRDLTRWVYENENGSISAPLLITDKFVVAYLGKIKKEGTKSVEDAKEEVTPIIKNDKKKDKLVAKMQEALEKNNSLEGLAKALNTNVNSADNITYMNTPTPNLANEPALIGYIAGTKPKKVSPPIKGETAVFVVNVKSFSSVTPPATFPEKVPMMRNEQARAANEATNALRESADIKDYRFMFY